MSDQFIKYLSISTILIVSLALCGYTAEAAELDEDRALDIKKFKTALLTHFEAPPFYQIKNIRVIDYALKENDDFRVLCEYEIFISDRTSVDRSPNIKSFGDPLRPNISDLESTGQINKGWVDVIEGKKAYYIDGLNIPSLKSFISSYRNNNIISHSLFILRSHPSSKDLLIGDAIIINHTEHALPFPKVKFIATNDEGQIVVSQIIAPENYLKNTEYNSKLLMPSGKMVSISFDIKDEKPLRVKGVEYNIKIVRSID